MANIETELGLNLSLPEGPILQKYLDFMLNEEFLEACMAGAFRTAKSNALVDFLALSALYYPGAQILFARNNLTDLKASTLMRLKERWGATFDSENNVEAVYRFPPMPHPVSGQVVQSEIRCIGLDRTDLESVLRSREFFRVGLEEGNQMQNTVHNFVIARCRQDVYHKELTNKDWLLKQIRKWGVSYEEAVERLGWDEARLQHPMRGLIGVRTVFNPDPNDSLWKRYVGVAYPSNPTPEWMDKHIGIRRVEVDAEQLNARGYTYQVGDMVKDPYGNINYVLREDEATGKVELVKPCIVPVEKAGSLTVEHVETKTVPKAALKMIVERYSIYAWPWENKSGNQDNTKASFLIDDKETAERFFEGKFNPRVGRVFPMFDRDIHVRKAPPDYLDRVARLRGIVGLDQGGAHATAAVFFALTRMGTLVAFNEYTSTDESATTTAQRLKMVAPFNMKLAWFCDPAMRARQFATFDMASTMDRYMEAGIPVQSAPESGDRAIDTLRQMLEVKDDLMGYAPSPGLVVYDHCEKLIEMFETIEWRDVTTRRYKEIVDVLDAAKFGACARAQVRSGGGAQVIQQDFESPDFGTNPFDVGGNSLWNPQQYRPESLFGGQGVDSGVATPDTMPGMSEWRKMYG